MEPPPLPSIHHSVPQVLAARGPFNQPADIHAIKLRVKRVVLLSWLDRKLHKH